MLVDLMTRSASVARCRRLVVVAPFVAALLAASGSWAVSRSSAPPRPGVAVPGQVGCSTAVAPARALAGVSTAMVRLDGSPFGIASTRDARWSFVDELPSSLLVFSDADFAPRLVRTITVPGGAAVGNALTADGRYLLVAGGQGGLAGASDADLSDVDVVSVARAEAGVPGAVLGTLRGAPFAQRGPIEVTSSADGHYAFVSVEYADEVAVYDLRSAIADRFARPAYIGSVSLGSSVVGLAVSPDGRWLYATSEVKADARGPLAAGTLSVIDIDKAGHDPAHSVVATVPAQCSPVRVAVSPDGQTVWVSARGSDDLLAFSAPKLRTNPAQALIASVRVGAAPVGLALADSGRLVVVADSNRFNQPGAHAALTVVDTTAALAGRPAVIGTIPAGAFPREMSLEGKGTTLLVSNFTSKQLEAVQLRALDRHK
jgi:DNA-binding beta-propeller fold protein YncE